MVAAEEYASRHGEPGTAAYRAAWLRFHRGAATGDLREERPGPPAVSSAVVRVLKAAIERAMLIDGAQKANAQLLDPNSGGLRIVAHSGFKARFLDFFAVVEDTESACGSALAAGTPVWVPDTTRSPIFAGTPALEVMLDAGSRAVASVPVTSPNGRLMGMISTHHSRPVSWTDRHRNGLQSLANSTGRLLAYLMPTGSAGREDLHLQSRNGAQDSVEPRGFTRNV